LVLFYRGFTRYRPQLAVTGGGRAAATKYYNNRGINQATYRMSTVPERSRHLKITPRVDTAILVDILFRMCTGSVPPESRFWRGTVGVRVSPSDSPSFTGFSTHSPLFVPPEIPFTSQHNHIPKPSRCQHILDAARTARPPPSGEKRLPVARLWQAYTGREHRHRQRRRHGRTVRMDKEA